jgi:hypothetical protein
MRDPDAAAHGLGKLLKHVGEDNVLWGTDSIWYGSPQDQIQAFRTFQISDEFADKFGYPKITPAIRARFSVATPFASTRSPTTSCKSICPRIGDAGAARIPRARGPGLRTYGPKTPRNS